MTFECADMGVFCSLMLQNTDADLYNQLCFYRHVFDKCAGKWHSFVNL